MNWNDALLQWVHYGIRRGLIGEEDRYVVSNALLSLLWKDSLALTASAPEPEAPLPEILKTLVDEAVARGLCGESVSERDLFDTAIMGLLTPRPREVISQFKQRYCQSPQKATDWFYQFSQDTNYIRRDRMSKNCHWLTATAYGDLDVTINLAKPEKDPKAIAAALKAPEGENAYPQCQLCWENEGYAGRLDHPARQNHRVIPISIGGKTWGFQYSPYGYYNEHCIAFNKEHIPMKIDRQAFRKLFDFVTLFPHYFIGSNADLPVVGGSILTHDHFQGGRCTFAIQRAPVQKKLYFKGYEDIEAGRVRWPMTTIRLTGKDPERLIALADHVLKTWRDYSDRSVGILAETEGTPHNTITPIVRRTAKDFQIDLVLRNNRTTAEYPLGIFHPHPQYHHIKKENIGLIEAMGLAILSARLKRELTLVEEGLVAGTDLERNEMTAKHASWAKAIAHAHPGLSKANVGAIVRQETGKVFCRVLENAGVYKNDAAGVQGFSRLIAAVNGRK